MNKRGIGDVRVTINLDWVLSQIDDAGGKISQKDLRNRWNIADKPYSGFGSAIRRLAKKGFVDVTDGDIVSHATMDEMNAYAK